MFRTFLIAVLTVPLWVGCSAKPRRGPTLVDDDAPTEFQTTDSGLQYRIVRRGTGERPNPGSVVVVDYSGKLDNGRTFDESYGRSDSVELSLGKVVLGWKEGLQLVREGGMIDLIIPPEMGYGSRGTGSIPPNSTLNFRVELHEVR